MAVVGALAVAALFTVQASRAAFSSTTSNGSNTFAAGTVVLADDDAGSVMFSLSGMTPGTTATKCVNVTYTGSVTADIKLYGTVAGTGLATYLDTVIDVGSAAAGGASLSCTGFVSSSNLFTGTLAAFGGANTNYANGLGGFSGGDEPDDQELPGHGHVAEQHSAQGLNANSTLTWEAHLPVAIPARSGMNVRTFG